MPKLKGGAKGETVLLHSICHNAVRARLPEAELARRLSDVDALRRDPDLAAFVAWVRTKPPDVHAPTRSTRSLKASRGRDRR